MSSEVIHVLEGIVDKEVLEKVNDLYTKLYKKYPNYSMKKSYVLACLVYIAERELKMPQDWQKICSTLHIGKREALSHCDKILKALELPRPKPLSPQDYAIYGLKRLGIDNEQIKNEVLSLLDRFDSINPAGYAAAAIYKVLRDYELYYTEDIISAVVGTTSTTLRRYLKKLKKPSSRYVSSLSP